MIEFVLAVAACVLSLWACICSMWLNRRNGAEAREPFRETLKFKVEQLKLCEGDTLLLVHDRLITRDQREEIRATMQKLVPSGVTCGVMCGNWNVVRLERCA
jgi:hypothetical protein